MSTAPKSGFLLLTILNVFNKRPWNDIIREDLRLIFSLTLFIIDLLVLAGVLYLAGFIVVGGKKARITDAIIVSLLGTIFTIAMFMFIPYPFLPLLLSILVWLLLIKRFYETGWLGAIAVSILAIVVFLAIVAVVALLLGLAVGILDLLYPLTIHAI